MVVTLSNNLYNLSTLYKFILNKSSSFDVHYVSSFIQAILVSPTGWANAATIDIIYDLLHMMGRDDIPVGLGDVFAMNQSDSMSIFSVGDCKYSKAIPHGSGGLFDSDTLYGLARDLPRSPRRYLKLYSYRKYTHKSLFYFFILYIVH